MTPVPALAGTFNTMPRDAAWSRMIEAGATITTQRTV